MPAINRRNLLANTIAAGTAIATVAVPAVAEAAATELPVSRVNRLAVELSNAMTEWMDDL